VYMVGISVNAANAREFEHAHVSEQDSRRNNSFVYEL
jgi:hypothetical protein